MLLGKPLAVFIERSPGQRDGRRRTLERVFEPAVLDQVFQEHAVLGYAKELAFSQCVQIMCDVVFKESPSVGAFCQAHPDEIPVTRQAVYDKLKRLESQVPAALVHYSGEQLGPCVKAMRSQAPPLLPRYRVRVLDGNHLTGTEHGATHPGPDPDPAGQDPDRLARRQPAGHLDGSPGCGKGVAGRLRQGRGETLRPKSRPRAGSSDRRGEGLARDGVARRWPLALQGGRSLLPRGAARHDHHRLQPGRGAQDRNGAGEGPVLAGGRPAQGAGADEGNRGRADEGALRRPGPALSEHRRRQGGDDRLLQSAARPDAHPCCPMRSSRLPPYKFEVRRVPPQTEAGAASAFSQGPAIDGSRPGLVYFNLHDRSRMAQVRPADDGVP